jgi:hypothetical protein
LYLNKPPAPIVVEPVEVVEDRPPTQEAKGKPGKPAGKGKK